MTNSILKAKRGVAGILFFSLMFFSSCGGGSRNAEMYLHEAENALAQKNYELAKLKIDSIKVLFPKEFDAINQGFQLMQKVRREENQRNINYCDSMLNVNNELLKKILSDFNYVRDERYQETGNYHPKIYPSDRALNEKSLRSGVSEKGVLYIESVLPGSAIRHNKVKVSAKDGSFAETLPVTSDGLNYRFTTVTSSYEIVRYSGADENGIGNFIFAFKDQPLTVTFIGNRSISVPISKAAISGICKSVELSGLLLQIETLKLEREKSQALMNYLESKNK